ncbi:hypothetical protein [Arenimonas sp.]|uniref:hypothetical protein n=1 Tax=Arenimonas sp. TaxID=1872635 RepID=UPI0035AE7B25
MSWSAGQQVLLGAMGYVLYRRAGTGAAPVPEGASLPEGPLLQAIRRAARRDDVSGLALPPYETLRAEASAKRALWARLRALRRSH